MAKAVAMNAKKNGALRSLVLTNWFVRLSQFQQFLESLRITEQDHEYWYGDRNIASKMVKDDVYNRVQHIKLEYLRVAGSRSNLSGWSFRPKQILAMSKPEWPRFLHFAAAVKNFVLDLDQAKLNHKDMELIAYALGENPIGKLLPGS